MFSKFPRPASPREPPRKFPQEFRELSEISRQPREPRRAPASFPGFPASSREPPASSREPRKRISFLNKLEIQSVGSSCLKHSTLGVAAFYSKRYTLGVVALNQSHGTLLPKFIWTFTGGLKCKHRAREPCRNNSIGKIAIETDGNITGGLAIETEEDDDMGDQ